MQSTSRVHNAQCAIINVSIVSARDNGVSQVDELDEVGLRIKLHLGLNSSLVSSDVPVLSGGVRIC